MRVIPSIIKKTRVNKKLGYVYVDLSNSGVSKTYRLHILVAKNFIPNPENKPDINHKDGDKLNNKAENLEWCTEKENTLHGLNSGLISRTQLSENAKKAYTAHKKKVVQYDLSGKFIASYNSLTDAFKATGILIANISRNINNQYKTGGGFIWKKSEL